MISCSTGHREELFLPGRMAEHWIPMKGMDRSKLSCRTLLFLFALLGMPLAAWCDTLENSARELARKIAAALPARESVSCEMHNASSLQADEIAKIEEALTTELQGRCVRTAANSNSQASIIVTFSGNLKSLVWTAEIRQGDTSSVAFITIPQAPENQVISSPTPMTLHSEKIWEGPERVIDAAFVSVNDSEQWLVLLVPDGMIMTKIDAGASPQYIEFPPPENVDHEPIGYLTQAGDRVQSTMDGRVCSVIVETATLDRCYVPRSLVYPIDVDEISPMGKVHQFDDYQVKPLPDNCGIASPMMITGTGDYTQPDSVHVFKDKAVVSNQLNFPGPVLRLSQGPDTQFVTAVVHDLKDGNYEVYRLSVSCGQ